jgi:4-amino-4-deoxy-L-arabinose transferase-like glycosyltransferase
MLTLAKKHEHWWYLILAVLAFFSFYFAIGTYPLFDNNEGLYASIAKFMLLHKEFIIPHLNCVPYIEKPPLLYWLLAGSFSLFGLTTIAARLVTTTCAVLTCIAIVFFAKKIKQSQTGIMAALIFTSSIGVSIIARMVYFDMLFTFLISCALFSLFYWYESYKISALRIGYLFLGLAILTKGLVAIILIFGSFFLFLVLEKKLRRLYEALDPMGIALFLAVVLPWHIAAIMRHQDFFRHYIIEEHFLRFLNQREPHDYYHGPIYYYLPRIMIYLFPWSLFAPLIFWRTKNISPIEKKLLNFSWSWLLVPLMFFSLSSAKANYYMIVSAPALAMILSIKITNLFTTHHYRTFGIWSATILFVTALALGAGYYLFYPSSFVIIAIVYALVIGITILFMARRLDATMVMIASLIIPIVIIMISYLGIIKNDISTEEAGSYLSLQAKDKSLYIYEDFENVSALAFYAPSCFKIIDSKSNDLYYGKTLPKFKPWFIDKKEFLHDARHQQVYIAVPIKKLLQFYREMEPAKFSTLKKFNLVTIVSNKALATKGP